MDRKMAEAIAQRIRSARCERSQRFHAEFYIGDFFPLGSIRSTSATGRKSV